MKKIAFLQYTEYYRTPRIRRHAEALVNAGYEVDCFVLNEKDSNKLKKINGVNIFYLQVNQYRGDSIIMYLFSYIHFAILSFLKLSIINIGQYKIINVMNIPEFIIISVIVNKFCKTKIILDMTDLMPELFSAKFKNSPLLLKMIYYLLIFQEKLFCYMADQIITPHELAKENMVKNHRVNADKIDVITNLPDGSIFNIDNYSANSKRKINVLRFIYHGTISKRFDFKTVIKSFSMLKEDGVKFQYNIYGKGEYVSKLLELIKKYKLEKEVFYKGFYPIIEMPAEILKADVGIVSYEKSDATHIMFPLKLMEYLSMGIPVITIKNKTIGYYFNKDQLFYYNYGDYDKLKDIILTIYHDPSILKTVTKNYKEKLKTFNWEIEKIKYVNLQNRSIK